MFYAEWCPYGTDTISDSDRLMGFETREERDEMVDRLNAINCPDLRHFVCDAVTTREIAHRYNLHDFRVQEKREEVQGILTCADRCFCEIRHKQSYEF